jgi:hypothetical protein
VDQATHNKIVSFIWGIADDVLRDLFKRGKYPDVILPMCVIRRMDAVLEPTKQKVLDTKQMLDDARITEQRALHIVSSVKRQISSRILSEIAVRAIFFRLGSPRASDSAKCRACSALTFAGMGGSNGSTTACNTAGPGAFKNSSRT